MSYIALANITLSSAQASVTFGSIPNTYRDLVIVFNGTNTQASDCVVSVNSDTTTSYTIVEMVGKSSGPVSSSYTRSGFYACYADASSRLTSIVQIMDYSATDKHKTALSRASTGTGEVAALASRWPSTSAITTVALRLPSGGNFSSGSTFALYGIAG